MPTLAKMRPWTIDDSWVTCWDDPDKPVLDEAAWASSGGEAAADAPPVSLDPDACNSPAGTTGCGVVPVHCGGMLDPFGGKGKRVQALKRFEALAESMEKIVLVTLTVDRKRFKNPRAAYRKGMKLVSKFLSERMGIRVWARVMEVQSESGDGWVHWHVLCDLQGTKWCGRSGWVDLAGFNRRAWSVWRGEFGMGGVDLQLIRSPRGAVGYCAKYLTKPWTAFPQWLLRERSSVRLFGCSKEAGRIIRERLGLPRRERAGNITGERRRRRRLIDRLASSGLSCKVLEERVARDGTVKYKHRGTFPVSVSTLISHADRLPGVRVESETFATGSREVVRLDSNMQVVQVRRRLEALGLVEQTRMEFRRRRRDLWESWGRMQSGQAG